MIIRELSLKNFLSHKDTLIELTGGINIFVGQNGSGKSSLFEAIKVAVFGPSDSDRKRLISYGENRSRISVTFTKGDHTYTVVRELESKRDRENTRTAYIDMDGNRVADGSTAVSDEFQKIVGISRSAFINSVYVDQGQMDSLIKEKPAERKNIFNEIIGLKFYDRVYDIVNDMYRKMTPQMQDTSRLKDTLAKLQAEIGELKNYGKRLKLKLEQLNKDYALQEGESDQIRQNVTLLGLKLDGLNKVERDADSIRANIAKNEGMLIRLKEKNADMEHIGMEVNQLKTSNLYEHGQELSTYESTKENLLRFQKEEQRILENIDHIAEIEASLKRLEDQRSTILPILKELESSVSQRDELAGDEAIYNANQKKLKEIEDSLQTLNNTIERIEPSIRSVSKLQEINAVTVEQHLDALNADRSRHREEQEKEKAYIETDEKNILVLNKKIADLTGKTLCPLCGQNLTQVHLEDIETQYRNEMEEAKSNIVSRTNHIKALETKLNKIEQERSVLQATSMKKLLEALSSRTDLLNRQKEIQNEQHKLDPRHGAYVKAMSTLTRNESMREVASRLDTEISTNRGQLEGLNKTGQLSSLEEVKENMGKTMDSLDKMKAVGELFSQGKRYRDFVSLRKRVEDLSSKLKEFDESKNETIRISSELDTARQTLKGYDLQIAERDNLSRRMREATAKRDETQRRLKDMQSEKEKIIGESSSNSTRIAQSEKDILETQEKIIQIKKKEGIYAFLDELKKAFNRDGIPRIIRERALESINSLTRNILSRFNLGIEDIRISDDLDIEVLQDGSEKNISQLSGGEKTSISIAMRMAIAKYLGREVSTILMDEPTVYLDEERRNDLKDILQYSMKELSDEGFFPQITIITHHQELEAAADLCFHVQKVNGISEVKAVD